MRRSCGCHPCRRRVGSPVPVEAGAHPRGRAVRRVIVFAHAHAHGGTGTGTGTGKLPGARRRRRGRQPATTRMRMPSSSTTWPARILAVLRSSCAPSTYTAPLATIALPWPPLSAMPASLSSWLSSTKSRSSSKSRVCMAGGDGKERDGDYPPAAGPGGPAVRWPAARGVALSRRPRPGGRGHGPWRGRAGGRCVPATVRPACPVRPRPCPCCR